jgi:hypothetical protein
VLIFLVIYITALFGTPLLVPTSIYIIAAACDRRSRRGVLVPLAMLGGCIGGLSIWSLVPRSWPLSLWETFAASVNSDKYGHPVEHYAEPTVLWILFGAVATAVATGVAAAMAERLRIRRRFV